jgi:hypothetical protein
MSANATATLRATTSICTRPAVSASACDRATAFAATVPPERAAAETDTRSEDSFGVPWSDRTLDS